MVKNGIEQDFIESYLWKELISKPNIERVLFKWAKRVNNKEMNSDEKMDDKYYTKFIRKNMFRMVLHKLNQIKYKSTVDKSSPISDIAKYFVCKYIFNVC